MFRSPRLIAASSQLREGFVQARRSMSVFLLMFGLGIFCIACGGSKEPVVGVQNTQNTQDEQNRQDIPDTQGSQEVRSEEVSTSQPVPLTDDDWFRPNVGTTWQWQLTGELNTTYDASVYDIDLDTSADIIAALHGQGRKVICYFSAGSAEDFRDDYSAFPPSVLGNPLDGYPDERWLDIRAPEVLSVLSARMDLAVTKGCDGIEPDNVGGYLHATGFDLTEADQLRFNIGIAEAAHARHLAVALKNDLDQIPLLVEYFDFAVNEQCHEYDECDLLQPFLDAGKAVFNAEYDDSFVENADIRNALCQGAKTQGLSTLTLPVGLDDAFRLTCE